MELVIRDPVFTERLALRGLLPADAEDMLAYRSLESVVRYVPFEPMDIGEIRRRLNGWWSQTTLRDDVDGTGLLIGVERRDTGTLIGDVSLFHRSAEHRGAEIGWLLHPDHGGRGFATEAAHGILHLAFERLGVHRVVAHVDARNGPSLRLCERLGMRREALLVENEWFKGGWSDEVGFALLEQEWAALHPSGPGSCRWPLTAA